MQIVKTIQDIWFADEDPNSYVGRSIGDKAMSCWWSTAVFVAKFMAGVGLAAAAFRSCAQAQGKLGATGLMSLAIFVAEDEYTSAFWPKLTLEQERTLLANAFGSAVPNQQRQEQIRRRLASDSTLEFPAALTSREHRDYVLASFKAQASTLPRHFFWLPQEVLARIGVVALLEGIACSWVVLSAPTVLARIARTSRNWYLSLPWNAIAVAGLLILAMRARRHYTAPPWATASAFLR
jgi:hypothetical protein